MHTRVARQAAALVGTDASAVAVAFAQLGTSGYGAVQALPTSNAVTSEIPMKRERVKICFNPNIYKPVGARATSIRGRIAVVNGATRETLARWAGIS